MNVFNLFNKPTEAEITTLDTKLETLSDKYKLVPTKLIADKFKSLGFVTADYQEVKVRKASRAGFQKHMVRMNNPKLLTSAHNDLKLQLVITNSHDGLSSFSIKLGIYRLVCSNGLMVGETFESVTLRHTGSIIEQVDQAVERMVAHKPRRKQPRCTGHLLFPVPRPVKSQHSVRRPVLHHHLRTERKLGQARSLRTIL